MEKKIPLTDAKRFLMHDLKDLIEHLEAMAEGLEHGDMDVEMCVSEMRRLAKKSRNTVQLVDTQD